MFQSKSDVAIQPIDNTNGILLLKQGHIIKQIDSFNLACTYNITHLHEVSTKLMSLYASTKAAENKTPLVDLHKTYRDQIEHNLNLIDKKLSFMAPRNRVKRGLINGLGSLVKVITGNLDNEDAIRIENEINNIRSSVNKISNSQKRTVSLAQDTINEFSIQVNKINENENRIASMLKNITVNANTVINQLHFLEIYVQISFSLQLILDKLMLLEDAMSFSQLGIMHPSIINPRNLILEINNLQKISSFKPVVEISMENIHKIEKSMVVKAYSTRHSLTFILEIPSTDDNIYDYIHIYSIPNKQNLTIIPKSKFLALGRDEYAYLEEDCKKISDDTMLCKSLDTRIIEKSEDCIISLIRQQAGNCTHARLNLKRGKLQKISETTWLTILTAPEISRIQCGPKTKYLKTSNVFLVTVTEDCQINLLNRTLRTHRNIININEVIPLPNQNIIHEEEVKYELHLDDLSLDSIHELMNKAEDIQEVEESNWLNTMLIPSWSTLLLYVLIGGVVAWKVYSRSKQSDVRTERCREDAPGSCVTSFHLKEGGVTTP